MVEGPISRGTSLSRSIACTRSRLQYDAEARSRIKSEWHVRVRSLFATGSLFQTWLMPNFMACSKTAFATATQKTTQRQPQPPTIATQHTTTDSLCKTRSGTHYTTTITYKNERQVRQRRRDFVAKARLDAQENHENDFDGRQGPSGWKPGQRHY